jgi:hypothetical protein
MKAIASLIVLSSLAAPAIAGPPRPKREPDALKKLDLGESYGLKARKTALPKADVDRADVVTLSENQMTRVIKDHLDEVQYCWMRVPRGKRAVAAAILVLAIEPIGRVKSVEINGDLPAGVATCIQKVASRWLFPATDAAAEISHGITLTTAGVE